MGYMTLSWHPVCKWWMLVCDVLSLLVMPMLGVGARILVTCTERNLVTRIGCAALELPAASLDIVSSIAKVSSTMT